jgi:hypothetical protein
MASYKLSSQGDIDSDIEIEGVVSLAMCSCVLLCPYNE